MNNQNLSERLTLFITPDLMEAINKKAGKMGLRYQDFCRFVLAEATTKEEKVKSQHPELEPA